MTKNHKLLVFITQRGDGGPVCVSTSVDLTHIPRVANPTHPPHVQQQTEEAFPIIRRGSLEGGKKAEKELLARFKEMGYHLQGKWFHPGVRMSIVLLREFRIMIKVPLGPISDEIEANARVVREKDARERQLKVKTKAHPASVSN